MHIVFVASHLHCYNCFLLFCVIRKVGPFYKDHGDRAEFSCVIMSDDLALEFVFFYVVLFDRRQECDVLSCTVT